MRKSVERARRYPSTSSQVETTRWAGGTGASIGSFTGGGRGVVSRFDAEAPGGGAGAAGRVGCARAVDETKMTRSDGKAWRMPPWLAHLPAPLPRESGCADGAG